MELENKIKELECIVNKLENPDLGMDEGVALYEQGINIAKECYKSLTDVKGKINIIKQDLETYKEESFD